MGRGDATTKLFLSSLGQSPEWLCSGHRTAEGRPPAAPGTLLKPQEPPWQLSVTATMTGPPWPPTWAAWALLVKSE